jgi:hypothetical protein
MPKILTFNYWRQILTSNGSYQPVPRVILYYFAIPFQLAASAIAGIGFVLYNPTYLLIGNLLWVIWFVAIFFVSIEGSERLLRPIVKVLKTGAIIIFIVLFLGGVTEAITLIVFNSSFVPGNNEPRNISQSGFQRVMTAFNHGFGYNDSTALSHQAAENVINGENPYQHPNVVEALLRFSPYSDRVTPLRVGRFADEFPYPSRESLNHVWSDAVKDPQKIVPEYANNLAYPAGDFLIPAAFMLIGIHDIRITYAIIFVLALAYVTYRLKSPQRYYFIGAVLISLELWNSIANGETGMLVMPFLLLSWFMLKKNGWVSAVFMGICVATKQTAWFFIPFYLIAAYKTYKLTQMGLMTVIIAGIFSVLNLPFMIGNIDVWVRSVFTPMSGDMYPLGVGLITTVTSGLINIHSPMIFDILEFLVLGAGIIWYFRYYKKYALIGPLLATIPLFFAWRSLWPYFFYTGIIIISMILSGDWVYNGSFNSRSASLPPGYKPGAV